MAVGETNENVIHDPKRRVSPRSNHSDQHPRAEKPTYATTRLSVGD